MQGYVIIDEAAFHDDLEEVLKAAYALLMWGGRVLVISTHDGADNVFNQQIQAIKEKRKGFKKHKVVTITFQDAINDGLYERICLVRGIEATEENRKKFVEEIYEFYGEGGSEELDVIPRKGGSVYFPGVLVEPCMVDVPIVRFEQKDEFFLLPAYEKERIVTDWCNENLKPLLDILDKDLQHSFGSDFARKGDLAVFAPMVIEKNTRRAVPFMLEMRNIPSTQQEQLLYYIVDRLPRKIAGFMDATGNGFGISEKMQERYGIHLVHAVKITVGWYEEALPAYRGAMQDGNIQIPKDADVLQDHRTALVVGGVPQIPRLKGTDDKQRHGDSLIALAGAYWATLQESTEYGYEAAFPKGNNNHNNKLTMRPDHSDDIGGAQRSRNFGNNRGAW
jgi:phage FluMu gp28-like protein